MFGVHFLPQQMKTQRGQDEHQIVPEHCLCLSKNLNKAKHNLIICT
jgi:hypothetical protein